MSAKVTVTSDWVDRTVYYKVHMLGCGHFEDRRMRPSTAGVPPGNVVNSSPGAKCAACRGERK